MKPRLVHNFLHEILYWTLIIFLYVHKDGFSLINTTVIIIIIIIIIII